MEGSRGGNFYEYFFKVINDTVDTLWPELIRRSLDRKYRLLSRHHVAKTQGSYYWGRRGEWVLRERCHNY